MKMVKKSSLGLVKNFSVFLMIFVLLVSVSPVFVVAQDEGVLENVEQEVENVEAEIDNVEAGSTPDSFVWGIDVAFDNLKLALSRNKEAKGLEIAQERLKEIEEMIKQGKIDKAEKAVEKHEEIIAKIKNRVESSSDGDNEKDLERIVEVEAALDAHQAHVEELEDNVGSLTPEQKRKLFAFLNSLDGNVDRFRLELDSKQERVVAKFEAKSGKRSIEIRDRLSKLKEKKRLVAEVHDDVSVVKVRYKFHYKSEDGADVDGFSRERLMNHLLDRIATSEAEANRLLKLHDKHDDDHDEVHELESELKKEYQKELEEESEVEESNDNDSVNSVTGMVVGEDNETVDEESVVDDGEASGEDNETVDEESVVDDGEASGEDEESKEEVGKDYEHDGQRIRFKVKVEKKGSKVEAEVDFVMKFISGVTKEEIVQDIVKRTNALTVDDLIDFIKIEHKIRSGDLEGKSKSEGNVDTKKKVEVEIKNINGKRRAVVDVEWNGRKEEFKIKETDRERVLEEVALKLGVTVDEVRFALKEFKLESEKDEVKNRIKDVKGKLRDKIRDRIDSESDGSTEESVEEVGVVEVDGVDDVAASDVAVVSGTA